MTFIDVLTGGVQMSVGKNKIERNSNGRKNIERNSILPKQAFRADYMHCNGVFRDQHPEQHI